MTTRIIVKTLLFFSIIINSLLWSPLSFSALIDSKQQGNIVYFLYASPNKIIRYDLDSAEFLSEIPLAKEPVAFNINSQHIYLAYNRELRRTNKEGGNNEFVRNFSIDIKQLLNINNLIVVLETNRVVSTLNSTDLSLVSTNNSSIYDSITGSNTNSSYYYSNGSSIYKKVASNPNDIISIYDRYSPHSSKLFINTSQNTIYTYAGLSYSAINLDYSGSLAGSFDNMTFLNDKPIVLRNNTLSMYDENGIDLGQFTLDHTPNELAANDDFIFSFVTSDTTVNAHKTDLANIQLPLAGTASEPSELNYQAEFIESDGNNNIYLADIETLSIFNWQLDSQDYGPSLALINPPVSMTLSTQYNRLYLGYSSGKITYFDLSLGEDAIETHLTSLAKSVTGLLATGNYLFATDTKSYSGRHYSFSHDGSTLSVTSSRNYSATEYIWNQYNHHLYQSISNQIQGIKIQEDNGEFGQRVTSNTSSLTFKSPLRINSDGSLLINGSGQILNTDNLTLNNSISNSIDDAVWIGKLLASIKSGSNSLQLWKENYELLSETEINDASRIRLFNLANQLLIIKQSSTGPVFVNHDLSNLADTDSDGINDLADNCASIANPMQEDFDQDNSGDDCDLDDDNDLIPDAIETQYGLDSLNADDASEDLDNDDFNNLLEFILATEMDNAESKPTTISQFNHNFDNGLPAGFYTLPNQDAWKIITSDDNKVLQSTKIINKNDSTSLFFSADFTAGSLIFKSKILEANYYYFAFELYLDGELQQSQRSYSVWHDHTVAIPSGIHTLEIRLSRNPNYSSSDVGYLQIKDIAFGPDQDEDGIINSIDNCPNVSNSNQRDSDDDGLGNDCDSDPYGYDRDKDGVVDSIDNCIDTYNPDQANIDNDYLGDACDNYDDRPTDSDQDGIPDYSDNCPNTTNIDQADLDYDGMGNVCDDDSDGDGIANNTEEQYSFLNSLDPTDAYADFDSDGAINLYEIENNKSPDSADTYDVINLLEYYPLGNIEYFYLSADRYLKVNMAITEDSNQYLLTYSNGSKNLLEKRDEGIFVLSSESEGYGVMKFENYPAIPSTLSVGGIKMFEIKVLDQLDPFIATFTTKFYLKSVGETEWQGSVYPSITLVENGNEAVYLKGLGQISFLGYQLDSTNFHNAYEEPESKPKSDDNSIFAGSMPFGFLLVLILLANRQRYVSTKK